MRQVFMEELTWPEIQSAMEAGADTVLICAAAQEQHGPHLPENTDYLIGRSVCGQVALELGNALVAPVIYPGLSRHHMEHPGSLTLRPETFCALVEDYVDGYVRHGFKNIVLCWSHGGNSATIDKLALQLNDRYPQVNIVSALPLSGFLQLCTEGDRMYNLEPGSCGSHACFLETSIMLYIRPELVHMDKAVRGYMSPEVAATGQKVFRDGMKSLTQEGILGDPTHATAEAGKVLLDLLCSRTAQAIREKLG